VISEINKDAYPVQLEWFAPFVDLYFPLLGSMQLGEMTVQLRRAHEPWPLLAEEISAGGLARFIDVANERVQVLITGLTPDRYQLTCNQRHVPLQACEQQNCYVAGVRYKACQPPSTMHPCVEPVEALVFDLLDSWTGHAVGDFTYRPTPPPMAGPTGVPVHPIAGLPGEPVPLQSPAYPLPPMVAGNFTAAGSASPVIPEPRYDCRHPYLLDLTRKLV